MFASYREIFDRRGAAYHEAMRRHPRARDREFGALLEQACIQSGQLICDLPSGGGYLADRIAPGIEATVLCMETSRQFFAADDAGSAHARRLLCDLEAVPLPDCSVDTVVSLAGLHHVTDKTAFYREAHRLLRGGGRLCIADVSEDSPVARFLDEFVGARSATGHCGAYLNEALASDLQRCGFSILHDAAIGYPWTFASLDALTEFCTLLFGLDRATPAEVAAGVEHHLGIVETGQAVSIPWQLTFVTACKPALPD